MARTMDRLSAIRMIALSVVAIAFGTLVGAANAQDSSTGSLNLDCARTCAANGYDSQFCGQVCWVPDLSASESVENLDWKCMTTCRARGGKTRECIASCRRY